MKRLRSTPRLTDFVVLALGAFTMLAIAVHTAVAEEVPDGVVMLLERGGIPAVFEPVFVSADEADITDDAWVLGVYLNGEAKAYSLNLLNHHEVVNDRIGGRPLAAVW